MASDEEIAPAGDIPAPICEKCEETMTHLSDLQPRLLGAALRVFRCYACNHVVSEER